MAFILLLLTSLSTLVNIELSTTQVEQSKILARQNAQLGLALALGELQKHAGADQRITARAEIKENDSSGTPLQHPLWTGIWDATAPDRPPIWLVSGENSSPTQITANTAENYATLVEALANSYKAVRAPRVSFESSLDHEHAYAWWVGDEGVKADLRPSLSPEQLQKLSTQDQQSLSHQVSLKHSPTLLIHDQVIDQDLSIEELGDRLSSTRNFADLLCLQSHNNGLGNTMIDRQKLAGYFHDFSLHSEAVLENVQTGGLQTNLADTQYSDSFLATDAMRAYLAARDTGELKAPLEAPPKAKAGEPHFSPQAIPTEIALYLGIFHARSDGRVRLRYHIRSEWLNPYPLPITFERDINEFEDFVFSRGFFIHFENLPTITVTNLTANSSSPQLKEDLNNFSDYPDRPDKRYLNTWIEIQPEVPAPTGSRIRDPILLAGELYDTTEPSIFKPGGLSRNFDTLRWRNKKNEPPTLPNDSDLIEIKAVHPAEGVNIVITPFIPEADPRTLKPLLEIRDLKFDDFTVQKSFNTGLNPFSLAKSGDYLASDFELVYHFRLYSDEEDQESLKAFLSGLDPREPIIDASAKYTDADGQTQPVSDLLDTVSSSPPIAAQRSAELFSLLDVFKDKAPLEHQANYPKMVLFDLPPQEPLSIGALRGLPLAEAQPYSLGNAWGGQVNNALDQYFFAATQANASTPSLRKITAANNPNSASKSAEDYIISRAFNINSTSAPAWATVLQNTVKLPPAQDTSSTSTSHQNRQGVFFRLPYTALEETDFWEMSENMGTPDVAFAQGVRVLSKDDINKNEIPDYEEQIVEISEKIVEKIKKRETPFNSLAAFANSGLLQEAIDEVGQDTDVPPINNDLPYSNIYLTQGDVIARLAPIIRPRSDTFRIRAYGEAKSNHETTPSKAWCEAIVQRLPMPLSPTQSAQDPANGLGRQFKIISFRWLDSPAQL